MSGIVRRSNVTYVLSQITPPTTVKAESRSVRCCTFPTLLDCYDFVVGLLIRDSGQSVGAAKRIALNPSD